MIYAQVPYRIEPELAASRPRRVRFTAETQRRRFRAWCVAIVPFVIVMVYGLRATEFQQALLTRGQTANARILSTGYVDSGRSSTSGTSSEPAIMFEFHANGATVIGRGVDHSEVPKGSRVGDSIVVTYLPEHPQSFVEGRMAKWQVVQKDVDWIIGSVLFGIAGSFYLFIVERYFWQQFNLLRHGVLASATVVSHHTAETGETATNFVHYEYLDSLHVKFRGTLGMSPKRARDYPDGSKLTVLCKPNSKEPGLPYLSITEAQIIKA